MGFTGRSPNSNVGRNPAPAALEPLSDALADAIKRRQVLIGLLRNAPQQVTENMLSKVRTGLEEALQNIAPYLESGKVNKEKIAQAHEAVYSLYAESIGRHIHHPTHKLDSSCDILAIHSHARQLVQLLQYGRKQIFALEQALKFGGQPDFKSRIKKQLKNSLALHFMNTARQYFMLETTLNTLRGHYGESSKSEDYRSNTLAENPEIDTYLDLLGQRVCAINIDLNTVTEKIVKDKAYQYEYGDLIPVFSPWAKELYEYSLGLANLLFRAMAGDESKHRGQDAPDLLQTCFDDLFESSIYLAEANDKLMAHGYRASAIEDKNETRRSTPKIEGRSHNVTLVEEINTECEEPTSTSTAIAPIVSRKIENVRKLLDKTPFAYFEKLKSHPTTFHPDTILASAKQSIKDAQGLKAILERQLADPLIAESELAGLIKTKLEDLDATLRHINLPTLQADLYKAYPFPQAGHWLALFEGREIAAVQAPQKLTSTKEHLYEVKIMPKANSDGRQADAVYLHLHLKQKPTPKRGQSLFGSLLANPDLVDAAHLKSSYYRDKGKIWETNEQTQGRYESLVRRSPIGLDFLKAVERFYSGRTQ